MTATTNPYDWLTLDDSEEILWQDSPTLETRATRFLGAIPFIFLFGFGLVLIAYHYYVLINIEYVITTKAIYRKQGLYSRSVQKIPLDNIQDTGFSESTAGRFFGYGALEISTAGGGGVEMQLDGVENPQDVQSILNKHMSTNASQALGVDEPTTPEQAKELNTEQLEAYLEEVKATRHSIETLRDNLN